MEDHTNFAKLRRIVIDATGAVVDALYSSENDVVTTIKLHHI